MNRRIADVMDRLPAWLRASNAVALVVDEMERSPGADPEVEREFRAQRMTSVARFRRLALAWERKGPSVTVYRQIRIPTVGGWEKYIRLRCLGQSWSFKRGMARVYYRHRHELDDRPMFVTMVGTVSLSDVDWEASAYLSNSREAELRLNHDAVVKINSVIVASTPNAHGKRYTLRPPLVGTPGSTGGRWEDCQ